MSRKRTPTALLQARGSRIRPNRAGEPQPDTHLPSPPAHLDAIARREYRRVGKELLALGVVSRLDRAALAGYCVSYSRWVAAEAQLARTGFVVRSPSGFPIQSPFLAIANRALDAMAKLAAEFGLTPASRSRVSAALSTPRGDKSHYFNVPPTIARPPRETKNSFSDAG